MAWENLWRHILLEILFQLNITKIQDEATL